MNVGTIEKKHDEAHGDYFTGHLALEAHAGPIVLVPNPRRAGNDKVPDYILKARRQGQWLEFGSGWLGKMKGEAGESYVSITIAAPGVSSIYVKAFPHDEAPNVFDVVWSPRKAGGYGAAPRATADRTDAIPFA